MKKPYRKKRMSKKKEKACNHPVLDVTIYHKEGLPLTVDHAKILLGEKYSDNDIDLIKDFRYSFELPSWPYGQYKSHFEQFMKDLGVIYYQDNYNVQPDPNNPSRMLNVRNPIVFVDLENFTLPCRAYRSRMILNTQDYRIMSLPTDWPRDQVSRAKKCPIQQDLLAYMKFNDPVDIVEIRNDMLKFKPLKNTNSPTGKTYGGNQIQQLIVDQG